MLERGRISIVRKFAIENSEEDDIHGFIHVEIYCYLGSGLRVDELHMDNTLAEVMHPISSILNAFGQIKIHALFIINH